MDKVKGASDSKGKIWVWAQLPIALGVYILSASLLFCKLGFDHRCAFPAIKYVLIYPQDTTQQQYELISSIRILP